MAPLLRFDNVSVAFGDQKILIEAMLTLDPGERVCLIGRNGAGKSTTLRLITGEVEPDEGAVERPGRLRWALLDQRLAEQSQQRVREFVASGMAAQMARIARFQELSAAGASAAATLREIEALQREIEAGGGWSIEVQVDRVCSELGLPVQRRLDELSGGWRRRVALAQALVSNPDLLLLDEPTNHLDITTIEWLEDRVRHYSGTVLFVTHDRSFVERVATRIVDIDRGKLRSWPGGYRDYLEQKAKSNEEEDVHNALFDKKLAVEETWIRQGVKARTTRNEGRVRALEELREQRAERIKRPRTARIRINESVELSGRKVIEARNVTHSFGGELLLDRFSLRVMRGDRVGIIGNNGVGKTTLLRILLGELAPDGGSVKLGTNLEVAYFDQLRREIDPTKTVAEIIGEGRDYVTIQGQKKHVVAYLLVLDEPTNDLDVETLEALESRLADYDGTLIAVSHDRYFLDAVVTSTLVFEAGGQIKRHAGGYSDWLARRLALAVVDEPSARKAPEGPPTERRLPSAPRKLSYKLQRELDALPAEIEGLEQQVAEHRAIVNEPDFYKRPHLEVHGHLAQLKDLEARLETAFERWATLEEQVAAVTGAGAESEPG
jgi:ATP-binding cassette subfamily F protein uup